MGALQRYRLRAPASGREAVIALESAADLDGRGYYDRMTGERLEVVAKLLPLAPAAGDLPRSPGNLRLCPFCEELVGLDLSDCPYCGRRMPALGR